MSKLPLVVLHRSTGTCTLVAGRKPTGSANGTALVPVVAIAPLKWTTPWMLLTAAFDLFYNASAPPEICARALHAALPIANEAPSRDVKHWALEKVPPSARTVTTPLGLTSKLPLVVLHRSIGTCT